MLWLSTKFFIPSKLNNFTIFRIVKNCGGSWIGTLAMFGGENIGGLSIYTEGNQVKLKQKVGK